MVLLGDADGTFAQAIHSNPGWGLRVVTADNADEVYVVGASRDGVISLLQGVDALGLPVSVTASGPWGHGGPDLITFTARPSSLGARAIKRTFDLLGGATLLWLAAPLLAALCVAIRLQDGGPAVFAQERVGRGGRRFTMYKLRTMVVGAHELRDQVLSDVDGPVFKSLHDPRVTRLGSFLRRSSLDELPQLLNVVWGEMSLVGPRPPLAHEVRGYLPAHLRRLSVPPGMTGLWQVSGRSLVPFARWMELDLEYVDRWSLWLDLALLARTLPAVLRGTGAR